MVTGYSTKIYEVLRILYYCKRRGLTFSFTVRTKSNTLSFFLHSVTTGSRDRANVSLMIIIIIIVLIILITSPWMDQTVRCLRKYYEGLKLQTLFLYLFDVYCMFHQYQTIFKVKTEKPKTEKSEVFRA